MYQQIMVTMRMRALDRLKLIRSAQARSHWMGNREDRNEPERRIRTVPTQRGTAEMKLLAIARLQSTVE